MKSKNKLEATVLDQHRRVKSAGENGHKVLAEAKGEILSVATAEQVQDILDKTSEVAGLLSNLSTSHLAAVNAPDSLPRNIAGLGGELYQLSDSGIIVPKQGYVGLITLNSEGTALDTFGFSTARGQTLQEASEDPIQKACGADFFYPPMMWAKALYSEAYNNRPESLSGLSVQSWLAKLVGEGLFLGSRPGRHGLLGATGFMPSEETMSYLGENQKLKDHFESEHTVEFRASGLMDQMALTHLTPDLSISREGTRFQAGVVLGGGGSLN